MLVAGVSVPESSVTYSYAVGKHTANAVFETEVMSNPKVVPSVYFVCAVPEIGSATALAASTESGPQENPTFIWRP